MVNLKIDGQKALNLALGAMPPKMQRQAVRPAVKKAVKPIFIATKENLGAGIHNDAMGTKTKIYRKGTVAGIIGPRSGYETTYLGKLAKPSMTFHFIENGFTDRGGVWHEGTRPLARAYEANRARSMEIMGQEVWAGIKRILSK